MTAGKHPLTPRTFVDLKVPHAPHISPDGARVVFEVTEPDYEESRTVTRLWMASFDEGKPRQITFSYEGESAPKWSPDGQWIAFLSARADMTEPPPDEEEEDPKEQLWVLPADGGEAQRLTNIKEGVEDYEWLPDSAGILFLTEEARTPPLQLAADDARKRKFDPTVEHEDRRRKQFWEVSIEEKKPELVYTGGLGVHEFDLSPDGKQVVYSSNGTGDPNDYHLYDLFVLDLEGESEPRKLVDRPGGKFRPRWSPDGQSIAFLSVLDPALSYSQECAWTVPAAGGEATNLFADYRGDAHDLYWSRADGLLYATAADGVFGPLLRMNAGESRPEPMPDTADRVCWEYHAGTRGVVAVLEDSRSVPELYTIDPGGGVRALTEFGKGIAEKCELPRQEVVRWTSDGQEIEGVLTFPTGGAGDARHPLVVQVHGGPKGRSAHTLRSYNMHPVWAAQGYLVFRPNYRGSEGYGNAFAVANRRDLGGGDYRDIMAGVDHLIHQGLADPDRLGIMGGSYGGYMTNWAIGQTERFRAAISMFGIFSLVTDFSNSELSRWDPEYMGAHYWEDPEIYRRCSPATHLEKMKTPVLIIHGDSDTNTFISNSREMYQALRQRGVPCQFVHYPREGHGMREPHHRLDEMRRCLAWMDRYLKGSGEAQPAYRIGDKVLHEGYELRLLRAEDAEYATWHEDAGRLLEVSFALASKDPVESGWTFALNDVRLLNGEEPCPLRGVPVDVGGGRLLVEGSDLAVNVHPDRETGLLSVAPALAFQIPDEGGVFTLRVTEFPPVVFEVGPKDKDEDE